jgi:AraC family transcriptional regulator
MTNWQVPLATPPRLRFAVAAVHGRRSSERHFLAGLWQLHLYQFSGELRLRAPATGGRELRVPIRPGTLTVLPPDTASEYLLPKPGSLLCLHFATDLAGGEVGLPMVQELGADAARCTEDLRRIIACAAGPTWASSARLWDLLLRRSERTAVTPGQDAVGRARAAIELRLGEPLRVERLAREAGCSPVHLRRLFRDQLGMGVKRYLLGRRVERAVHLLRHSDRPITGIAAEVGIPDLQQFNKTVRRLAGCSPRGMRRGIGTAG